MMAGPYCVVEPRHPAMRTAVAAYRRGFGASPVLTRLGGSIPVANTFQQALGIPALLMGFGLPDANLHAPNENLHLPTFFRAISTCTALIDEFAGLHPSQRYRAFGEREWGALPGEHAVIVIDCHCHAGKGDGLTGPWNTDAPLGDCLRWSRRAGIHRTNLFAAFHTDYAVANRQVARLVAAKPDLFYGFAFVHARSDAGRVAEMVGTAVRRYGFRGIKVHKANAPISREICETARALSLPVLYDVVGDVAQVDLLATEYPTVNFIIPHLGSFADNWRAHLAMIDPLTRYPNVYCDTSAVLRFDILRKAVLRCGPHKFLFGSDGPWLHPGVELAKVRALIDDLKLKPAEQQMILGGNFLRLLGQQRKSGQSKTGKPDAATLKSFVT